LVRPYSLFGADRADDYVIKAEDFGIPQARHRVVLLGVREDLDARPATYLEATARRHSVLNALGDLPRVRSGVNGLGGDTANTWHATLRGFETANWFSEAPPEVRREMRRSLDEFHIPRAGRGSDRVLFCRADRDPVLNHATRSHIVSDLSRYFFASCFARAYQRSPTLSDLPEALMPAHASAEEGRSNGHFADRFRVQLRSRPSSTITSHISKDGHYYIHYDPRQCRSLTVREAARLQTFPDDYFFCGPRTAQYHQVGNAVPPTLAAQIAGIVAAVLGL
jgi:DNA (cytosine-5)-methyltransferase 1